MQSQTPPGWLSSNRLTWLRFFHIHHFVPMLLWVTIAYSTQSHTFSATSNSTLLMKWRKLVYSFLIQSQWTAIWDRFKYWLIANRRSAKVMDFILKNKSWCCSIKLLFSFYFLRVSGLFSQPRIAFYIQYNLLKQFMNKLTLTHFFF